VLVVKIIDTAILMTNLFYAALYQGKKKTKQNPNIKMPAVWM